MDSSRKIDLRTIPIHVTSSTGDKYKARVKELYADLRNGGLGSPYVSIGKSSNPYWLSLRETFCKIWMMQRCPFLHLEDDARIILEHFDPIVHIPEDAALAYLGGTVLAQDGNEIPRGAIHLPPSLHGWRLAYSEYDHEWLRVYNMYSTHAVLVLDEKIKLQILEEIKKEVVPIDIPIARQMPKYRVYLRKRPFWYQTDGHNDKYTRSYYPPPEGSEVI